jgi:hypothetical protein
MDELILFMDEAFRLIVELFLLKKSLPLNRGAIFSIKEKQFLLFGKHFPDSGKGFPFNSRGFPFNGKAPPFRSFDEFLCWGEVKL